MKEEPAPDILNHWTAHSPAVRGPHPCFPPEPSKGGFTLADEPSPDALRRAIMKNLQAREQKKRTAYARRGVSNGRSKLDEIQVCMIRSMYNVWGLSIGEVARRWSLPRETVRDIIKRRTWTHV